MITVFGSINVDLVTRVERIPRPGETVHGSDYVLVPGGKGANQAIAARRAGAEVAMIGAVGDDTMAETALRELKADGVNLGGVATSPGTTGVALITVDRAGENVIVLSPGANGRARFAPPDRTIDGGTMLLQMEVPFAETVAAARWAAGHGITPILSIAPFSPLPAADLAPFAMIVVNEHEAAALASAYGLDTGAPSSTVAALADRLGKTVIATLGPEGAVAATGTETLAVPALKVDVVDTTGAGDTFAGALAAFLGEGMTLGGAMSAAAIAGSLACTGEGAQPSFPRRDAIDAAGRPMHPN